MCDEITPIAVSEVRLLPLQGRNRRSRHQRAIHQMIQEAVELLDVQ